MLAANYPLAMIERETRKFGAGIKAETVADHLANCLHGDRKAGVLEGVKPYGTGGARQENRDLATLVQQRAVELVEGGMFVEVKDGLLAQKLIDARVEKDKDREFTINLFRLMSGGGTVAPKALIDDGVTIDGDWSEIEEGEYAAFAPAELRVDDDA